MNNIFHREVRDLISRFAYVAGRHDYWASESLHSLWMFPSEAGRISSAAGLTLANSEQLPDAAWFYCEPIRGLPELNLEPPDTGTAREIRPNGRIWILSSRGTVFDIESSGGGHSVRFAVDNYGFDDGSLIRKWSHNRVTGVDVCETSTIRHHSDERPLKAEEAIAIMAALLRALDEYRLSLGIPNSFPSAYGRQVIGVCRRLLDLLRDPRGQNFDGAEFLAWDVERFLAEAKSATRNMEKRTKPKAARDAFMGPLQVAFRLLYGAAATSRFTLEDDAVQRADGPFIRFAEAFFETVGCPCQRNTINSSLQRWRQNQRRQVQTA